MTTAGSNFISGITTTIFDTYDVLNKQYVDANLTGGVSLPTQTGNSGKFLVSTDGVSTSWEELSGTAEFGSPVPPPAAVGFPKPKNANLFYFELYGAGGGGGAGQNLDESTFTWYLRTTTTSGSSADKYSIVKDENNILTAALGFPAYVVQSTDGIIWNRRTQLTGGVNHSVRHLRYFNGLYLLSSKATSLPYTQTSTNGIVWTLRTIPTSDGALEFAFGNVGGTNYYLAHVSTATTSGVAVSTNAIQWTLRTAGNQNTISKTYYANNTFFIVGNSKLISASTDTIHWSSRTGAISFGNYSDINYLEGPNLYFALTGGGGPVETDVSTDSIHWTLRTSSAQFLNTSFYNGKYIGIAGANGVISCSTDSIVWTRRTSRTAENISDSVIVNGNVYLASATTVLVSYGLLSGLGGASGAYTSWYVPAGLITSENIFVQVGAGGTGASFNTIVGSNGGSTIVSWTGPGNINCQISAKGTVQSNFNYPSVSAGASLSSLLEGNFVFLNQSGLSASVQFNSHGVGNTATTQSLRFQPTPGGNGAAGTSFSGGAGGSINMYGMTTSSSGGTPLQNNPDIIYAYPGIPYGPGGGGGGVSYDTHTWSWTLRTSGFGSNDTMLTIKYFDFSNIYLVGGKYIASSTNTITWILRTVPSAAVKTEGITFGQGKYVAVGSFVPSAIGGYILTSTDTITWTYRTGALGALNSIDYNSALNTFIATGLSATTTSTDTIHWTLRTSGGGESSVISLGTGAFTDGARYMIAGANGGLRASTNLIQWSLRTIGTFSTAIYTVYYTNIISTVSNTTSNLLFIGGNAGRVSVSTNSIWWELRTTPGLTGDVRAISYGNSLFIIGDSDGRIITSTNSIVWTLRTSNTSTGIYGLTYGYKFNDVVYASDSGGGFPSIGQLKLSAGRGADGIRGGGGGGGAANRETVGIGGKGGDGYVKITWW